MNLDSLSGEYFMDREHSDRAHRVPRRHRQRHRVSVFRRVKLYLRTDDYRRRRTDVVVTVFNERRAGSYRTRA